VLGREILAPSAHLQGLSHTEIEPKLAIRLGILSGISGLAPDDPALIPRALATMAPCIVMLVAGRSLPVFADKQAGLSPEALADQLCAFAIGGLTAPVPHP